MSNNREEYVYKDQVHLFLALQKPSKQGVGNKACIRSIIKHKENEDLKVFEAKIRALDRGEWRIYRTVNARDVKKAYKVFMKRMIDYPEKASCIDSEWRTALLQKECKAEKYFMLDVDTKEHKKVAKVLRLLEEHFFLPHDVEAYESPSGWHYITPPFDSREVCKLDYVTLLRDGYMFIKEIK